MSAAVRPVVWSGSRYQGRSSPRPARRPVASSTAWVLGSARRVEAGSTGSRVVEYWRDPPRPRPWLVEIFSTSWSPISPERRLQERVVVDAGADELDGGRGPEGVHALGAPHPDALLVALQHGQDLDAAAAEVAVELGQRLDGADVRGLVEHGDQGWVEAAAAGLGGEFGDLEDPVDQGGDDRGGGAGALLGQQVHRRRPHRRPATGAAMPPVGAVGGVVGGG